MKARARRPEGAELVNRRIDCRLLAKFLKLHTTAQHILAPFGIACVNQQHVGRIQRIGEHPNLNPLCPKCCESLHPGFARDEIG